MATKSPHCPSCWEENRERVRMRWCEETWETNAGWECPVCEEFWLPKERRGPGLLDRGPEVDAYGRCYSDALPGF